jgi:hypothetical protein
MPGLAAVVGSDGRALARWRWPERRYGADGRSVMAAVQKSNETVTKLRHTEAGHEA